MDLATRRPDGDSRTLTIRGSTSGCTLRPLPLWLGLGESLFRNKLSDDRIKGLAAGLSRLPGRLLQVHLIGSTTFAAESCSSAAACATLGRSWLTDLRQRGDPESLAVGSLATVFTDCTLVGSLRQPIPVVLLTGAVPSSICAVVASASEAAAIGAPGLLMVAAAEQSLRWMHFGAGVGAACRVCCMIDLRWAGAALLRLALGFVGLPRHLAGFIATQQLWRFGRVLAQTVFYFAQVCFLDGISMVVLTTGQLLPTVRAAGSDLIGFGICTRRRVALAQITPPVGLNLFLLLRFTDHDLSCAARTAMPKCWTLLLATLLSCLGQTLILWLPSQAVSPWSDR